MNFSSKSPPSSTFSILSFGLELDITDNNELSDFEIIYYGNFYIINVRKISPNILNDESPKIAMLIIITIFFFFLIQLMLVWTYI